MPQWAKVPEAYGSCCMCLFVCLFVCLFSVLLTATVTLPVCMHVSSCSTVW